MDPTKPVPVCGPLQVFAPGYRRDLLERGGTRRGP